MLTTVGRSDRLNVLECDTTSTLKVLLRALEAAGVGDDDIDVVDVRSTGWWLSCASIGPELALVRDRLAGSGARSHCRVAFGGAARTIRRYSSDAPLSAGNASLVSADTSLVEVRGPALVVPQLDEQLLEIVTAVPGVSHRVVWGAGWTAIDEVEAGQLARDLAAAAVDSPSLTGLARRLGSICDSGARLASSDTGHQSAPVGPFTDVDETFLGIPWDDDPCDAGLLLCWIDQAHIAPFARAMREWVARGIVFHPSLVGCGHLMQWWDYEGTFGVLGQESPLKADASLRWVSRSEDDFPKRPGGGQWIDIAEVDPDVMVWGLSSDVRSASSLSVMLQDIGVAPIRTQFADNQSLRWARPSSRDVPALSEGSASALPELAARWVAISANDFGALRSAMLVAAAHEEDWFSVQDGLVGSVDELALLNLDPPTLRVLRVVHAALQQFDTSQFFWAWCTVPIRHLLSTSESPMPSIASDPGTDGRLRVSAGDSMWTWVTKLGQPAVDAVSSIAAEGGLVTVSNVAGVEDVLALRPGEVVALVRELRAVPLDAADFADLVAALENWLDERWDEWRTWQPDFTVLGFTSKPGHRSSSPSMRK